MALITKKESLTGIADAIRAKTGKTDTLSYPDEFISGIESISTKTEPKNINFWDYDGTLLYSYTLDEFTEFPSLPEHDGLTAVGWNVTDVSGNKYLDVGAIYEPTDGNIHIKLKFQENDNGSHIKLAVTTSDTGKISIDWGDGSTDEYTDFSDMSHFYNVTDAEIVITLENIDSIELGSNGSSFITEYSGTFENESQATVTGIILNSKVTSITVKNFINLETIVTGNGLTSLGDYALANCYTLKHINLPANLKKIGSYCFQNDTSLEHCSHGGIETCGTHNFYGCANLKKITGVPYENYQFYNCFGLQAAYYKDGYYNVGEQAFANCSNLEYIQLTDSIKISESAFFNCYRLKDDVFEGVTIQTILAKAFWGASNLRSLTLGDGVSYIDASLCRYCSSLASVRILGDIDSIGDMAFNQMFHLTEFYMPNVTKVPTIPNSYSIQHAKTFKIYVPTALVDEFKAATNWSGLAYYITGIDEGE